MEPGARHVTEDIGKDRQVARDGRLLGGGRPATQPEHGRDEAVVRLGPLGQRELLGVVDDRQPERAGIRERRAQDRGGSHRRAVVREADHPRVGQLAERRQSLPSSPDRHRPMRQQLDRRPGRGRGGPDPGEDARLVEGRRRVRHGADRGEAAVHGRGEPGRDRLGVLVAGLAQVHVEIDEARGDDDAVRVDARGVRACEPCHRLEDAVAHHDLARTLAPCRRIHQPGAADLEIRSRAGHAAPVPPGWVPASR